MNVTTTCRDISELLHVAQKACKLLFQECYKAGLTNIFITETYRSQARQNYLYEQGRTRLYDAKGNKLAKVTWTLNSRHTSKLAWDIAVGPPHNLYDAATLTQVGTIARRLGITWGGDWSNNIDRPHFEVTKMWKIPVGYKFEGEVIIPTDSKTKVNLIKKEEELTVSQAEQLQKQIDELKKMFNPNLKAPSEWAKDIWERAVFNGYFDGSNPTGIITKEQTAKVLNLAIDNIYKYKVLPLEKRIAELEEKVKELEQI